MRLAGAVHGDGIGEVARVLSTVETGHLPGLAIVLAAMVDVDATPHELLGWVTWDETGQPCTQGVLFGGLSSDPETWSDAHCANLHKQYRAATRPGVAAPADLYVLHAGSREHERRRQRRRRMSQRASTAVDVDPQPRLSSDP